MKKENLLRKLQKPQHLHSAWRDLNKSNPGSYGPSGVTLRDFAADVSGNIAAIRKQLAGKRYKFAKVRPIVIQERRLDGSPKPRPIRVADIRDRVVQRAIARLIEPILNLKYRIRNEASFAYQKKKGLRDAQLRMLLLYQDNNPIVFEADLQKFFETVPRSKLLEEYIYPALPDKSLNSLIQKALAQEIDNAEALSAEEVSLFADTGIPQGGALSPLLANVYLSKFDSIFLSKGFGLIRYADDFIVMCKDFAQAKEVYQLSKVILEGELGLKLHEMKADGTGKTKIVQVTQTPFEFLGARFNGRRLWPSDSRFKKLEQRLDEITEFDNTKRLVEILRDVKWLLEGWISAYCHTDITPRLSEIRDRTAGRVGHCGFKMKWLHARQPLSDEQWLYSGLPDLLEVLNQNRVKLAEKEEFKPLIKLLES